MEFKIQPPIMFWLFPHNKLYVAKKIIKKMAKAKSLYLSYGEKISNSSFDSAFYLK